MRKLGFIVMLALVGCSNGSTGKDQTPTLPVCGQNLANRAYIVSRDSEDLTVLDLDCLEIAGSAKVGTQSAHMAEMGPGLEEIFITSSGTNDVVVVNTKDLKVKKRMPIALHPTHMSTLPNRDMIAVMVEGDNAVSFLDTKTDKVVKTIYGFYTPHFMRFSADGKTGFVANLGAHHITRVNLDTLEVEGHIVLDGFQGPPNASLAEDEGGFADAQVDTSGILYAAHAATGRVLSYDTKRKSVLPEIKVGDKPWVVFADHFFKDMPLRHVVPNLGSETLSLIDGPGRKVLGTVAGDKEAYGVNYSPLVPDKAFVMNRVRQDIAVVDTATQKVLQRIDVGGNTETASTSADGKYIVAAVSSANRVVVLDAVSGKILKRFENVGVYPWSVVIPGGQNYCH